MRIQTSLDWSEVGLELRNQMHAAPARCRKDLARMIAVVEGLVQRLGNEEVEMRRSKKTTSVRQQELLQQIHESITEYEKWLLLAYLQHG